MGERCPESGRPDNELVLPIPGEVWGCPPLGWKMWPAWTWAEVVLALKREMPTLPKAESHQGTLYTREDLVEEERWFSGGIVRVLQKGQTNMLLYCFIGLEKAGRMVCRFDPLPPDKKMPSLGPH